MTNKTYSAASGQGIYGGRFNLPLWRQGMNIYDVVAIPHVAPLSSINPENNPAINPNYPSPSQWKGSTGFASVVSGYCGAAWDDVTGRFWLPLGGGHNDYGGNETLFTYLMDDAPVWQMLHPPSGAVGNVILLNDGAEASGLYSDGRFRAVHSYGYPLAMNGRVYNGAQIATFYSGQSGKGWFIEIDAGTGDHSLVCDYTTNGANIGSGYGATAGDPTRNKAYVIGKGSTRIVDVNLNNGAFAPIGGSAENILGEYCTGIYIPEADKIMFVAQQTANTAYRAHRGLIVINPANNAVSYPVCENYPSFLGGAVGAAWCGDKLLLWDNATQTNKFAVLTPSNPNDLTQPWTVSEITGIGETITQRQGAGTYNRLQYSKRLGGVLLYNDVTQPIFFMRTN